MTLVADKAGKGSELTVATRSNGTLLQRKCACGSSMASLKDECEECKAKKRIQPKVNVGSASDRFEQEADRIAEQVLSDGPGIHSHASQIRIQRLPHSVQDFGMEAPASVDDVLLSQGNAMVPELREDMESRFGYDFSRVRLHVGERAERSAREVAAEAYTVGPNIVFGRGTYAPHTNSGRRLIAHELTHVVQQTQGAAAQVQRTPITFESKGRLTTPNFAGTVDSGSDTDPLYFWAPVDPMSGAMAERVYDCPNNCHQQGEKEKFQSNRRATPMIRVTLGTLMQWAEANVWDIYAKDRMVLRRLQRREDAALREIWSGHKATFVERVRTGVDNDHKPYFEGSQTAKARHARALEENWPKIIARLHRRAENWLVDEVRATLRSGVLPEGSKLVTDPNRVIQIEDHPILENIDLGRWGALAKRGFEWVGKRAKSVDRWALDFEVKGHEAIYYHLNVSDFQRSDPFFGKVASDVASNTKFAQGLGLAVKGFLTGLASPLLAAYKAGTEGVDVATQFTYVMGWQRLGYTCVSDTCKHYEACIKAGGDHEVCANDLQIEALKQATIIVPLYEQGRDCLNGDAESCGGLAELALGLAKPGAEGPRSKQGAASKAEPAAPRISSESRRILSQKEYEGSLIRQAIDRPLSDDAGLPRLKRASSAKRSHAEPNAPKGGSSNAAQKRRGAPKEQSPAEHARIEAAVEKNGVALQLEDGKHHVGLYDDGKTRGFRVCSLACDLVQQKLEALESILPKSKALRDVSHLRKRVEGLDRAKMTADVANNAAFTIARELAEAATKDANLAALLPMTVAELEAGKSVLKRRLRAGKRVSFDDIERALDEATEGTATGSKSTAERSRLTEVDQKLLEEQRTRSKAHRLEVPVESHASLAAAKAAKIPPEVSHGGTVMTVADFPELIPDRPLPRGKRAPKLPDKAEELKRGVAGKRPTSDPKPKHPHHTELQGDVALTVAKLEEIGATVDEIAINRTQRSGDVGSAQRASRSTRPDLQLGYVDAKLNGRRVVIEYDTPPGNRAMKHARDVLSKDPDAIVILKIIPADR